MITILQIGFGPLGIQIGKYIAEKYTPLLKLALCSFNFPKLTSKLLALALNDASAQVNRFS